MAACKHVHETELVILHILVSVPVIVQAALAVPSSFVRRYVQNDAYQRQNSIGHNVVINIHFIPSATGLVRGNFARMIIDNFIPPGEKFIYGTKDM